MKGLSVLQFLTPNGSWGFSSRGASLCSIPATIPGRRALDSSSSQRTRLYFTAANKVGLCGTRGGLIQSAVWRNAICLAPRLGAQIVICCGLSGAINTFPLGRFVATCAIRKEKKVSFVLQCMRIKKRCWH